MTSSDAPGPPPEGRPANPNAADTAPPEFPRSAPPADLTPVLRHLLDGGTLDDEQAAWAFEAMMGGGVHHGEMGALLALLATRTPAASEIAGAARVMRRHVDRLPSPVPAETLVDTAGTGGAPKTWNVSTAAAIVAAAAGARLAKHGNRSRTGRGSAEVLAALGVDVDAPRPVQARCLEEVGVCFCYAIHHHPSTRNVMPVRKALGFPTIFNLLGPLTNPAGARRQVMGVYEGRFLEPIARAMAQLETIHALVVHSEDGLDELSISAPTMALRVRGSDIEPMRIDPAELGLALAPREAVTARDLDHAAEMVRATVRGEAEPAVRDMALLAAAATLLVADRAATIGEGLEAARAAIDDGRAAATLDALVRVSSATGDH